MATFSPTELFQPALHGFIRAYLWQLQRTGQLADSSEPAQRLAQGVARAIADAEVDRDKRQRLLSDLLGYLSAGDASKAPSEPVARVLSRIQPGGAPKETPAPAPAADPGTLEPAAPSSVSPPPPSSVPATEPATPSPSPTGDEVRFTAHGEEPAPSEAPSSTAAPAEDTASSSATENTSSTAAPAEDTAAGSATEDPSSTEVPAEDVGSASSATSEDAAAAPESVSAEASSSDAVPAVTDETPSAPAPESGGSKRRRGRRG